MNAHIHCGWNLCILRHGQTVFRCAVEEKLKEIEKKITIEQMEVQRKYEPERAPLLAERDAAIGGMWGQLICLNKFVRFFLNPAEAEILMTHLKSVSLKDALDNYNSYEVSFTFDDAAAEIFEPTTITRKTVFNADNEVDEEKSELTTITFKDAAKDPRELIKKFAGAEEADPTADDMPALGSIFEWFSSFTCVHPSMEQFGEFFRSEIYPEPFPAASECASDCDSDDEDAQAEPETAEADTAEAN